MQKNLNGKWLFKQSDKTQWLDASVPVVIFSTLWMITLLMTLL